MKHLLSIDDLSTDEIAPLFETAADMHDVQSREVKKLPGAARPHGRQHVLRGLHPHPVVVRDRRQVALRRRHQRQRQGLEHVQGREPARHRADRLRDGRRRPRHPAPAPAAPPSRSASGSTPSVVNAGDGMHEHPTQALLDAYTLQRRLGSLEGRHVAIIGDLTHSRVFRSNVQCLTRLGARVTVVAPPTLMPSGIGAWSAAAGFETSYDIDAVLPEADAVMMLRVQRERMSGAFFPSAREYTVGYGLTRNRLALLKPDVPICHPGPMNRGLEIAADAADAAQSVVLEQVSGGLAIRMAVLYHLLAGEPRRNGLMSLVIKGASLLGEQTRDLYVDDAACSSTRRPSGAETHRRRRPGRPARARRPAHPPARARPRGRRDHPHRLAGRRARRLHRGAGDGQHLARSPTPPRPPTRVWELGREAGLVARAAGRRGDARPGRRGAGRARPDAPLARRRDASSPTTASASTTPRVMRRALEYVKAFGGVVSQHSQDPTLAGAGRLLPRGRAVRPARAARLAGDRRGGRSSRAT